MKCPRCSGLVVDQYGEIRCLLCAWYYNPPSAEAIREPYQRKERCTNCLNKVEAGYTQCGKCRRYQSEYRKLHPRRNKKVAR